MTGGNCGLPNGRRRAKFEAGERAVLGEGGLTVRAVIWDFGGVFTSSPFDAFARYEAGHGLPRDFIRRINAGNPDTNAWAKLERSEIDAETFDILFAEESARAGHRVGGRDILDLLAGEVRPAMVSALIKCREKLTCACITNNAKVGLGPGMTQDRKKSEEVARIIDLFDLVI
ncbi:MAG: hypothetical protein ACTSWM_05465, partial [Alphaproteobacteria bacterium]